MSRTIRPLRAVPASLPLVAVLAVLGALALPAAALAADPVAISGTVTTADAAAAAGVEVSVVVEGSDIAQSTTTDDAGAFALDVDAGPGDTLDLRATGATVRVGPDEDGCVTSTTPTGSATVVLGEEPPGSVAIVLDGAITDRVCAATATPEQPTKRHHPRPTPPPTDGMAGRAVAPTGWVAIVAGLACLSSGLLLWARRRGQ